jgi:hypothetical protein
MLKKKLKITKEMLQEKLFEATECRVQHLGFPCNTCFHALSLKLRYDIHNYWVAVLAFRGDYKELKQKPRLIE